MEGDSNKADNRVVTQLRYSDDGGKTWRILSASESPTSVVELSFDEDDRNQDK